MLTTESFERQPGVWIKKYMQSSDSAAAGSIVAVQDRLGQFLPPSLSGTGEANSFCHRVVRFKSSILDIRVSSHPQTYADLDQHRVVAQLDPEVVGDVWMNLSPTLRELPEELRAGATVIIRSTIKSKVAHAAITTPNVPERRVPELNYTHVQPGTLVRTQQGYPRKDEIRLDVRPDFYTKIQEVAVTVDNLLSGVVDRIADILGNTEALASLGALTVDPVTSIGLAEF